MNITKSSKQHQIKKLDSMQRHITYNQKKNQLIEADSEMKEIIKSVAIINNYYKSSKYTQRSKEKHQYKYIEH